MFQERLNCKIKKNSRISTVTQLDLAWITFENGAMIKSKMIKALIPIAGYVYVIKSISKIYLIVHRTETKPKCEPCCIILK